MNFVCSKTVLNLILNIVQKAIGAKSAMPILDCIKIDAKSDGHAIFTANSMEFCIEYDAELTVYESGSVALPSKIFGEIVRKLPEGEVDVTVKPDNFHTVIKCEASEFSIQGMDADKFTATPIVDEKYRIQMNQRELKQIIRKVGPFISQIETRKPVLMGALFDIKGSDMITVATDSHRLAVIKSKIEANSETHRFVIPGVNLAKIGQILSDDEEAKVDVIISDNYVMFDFKNHQIYSRLLEGEFLKYEVLTSTSNSIKIKADKQSIIDSLERANLIINDEMVSKTDNKMPVKLSIAYNKVDISCKTTRGYVNDTVIVEHEGGDIVIGFNCRFMLDALNSCDDENVVMEFSAPTSGCFIKPEDGSDRYTFMVLPVRLYN
mgnify:FL=1